MLIDIIEKESVFLQNKIKELEPFSNPEHLLSCNKNHSSYKWVARNCADSESVLISKNDEAQAIRLANSTYNHYLYDDYVKEKKALDHYIDNHALLGRKSDRYLENPEVRRLLSLSYNQDQSDYFKWAKADYEKCTDHPENLIVKCKSGNIVRSKSEAMIDMALFQHGIPYRYEDTLRFDGITLHPDFHIRHPKSGQFKIWEHFGLIDNPLYASNASKKIQRYINNGYYPNINLIITSETSSNPIDMGQIEAIINYFF